MIDLSMANINQEQAQAFARAIYTDIADYIKNHQEDYKNFVEKESK